VKAFAKKSVPVYITEMGVPTYNGPGGLSDAAAAQYVVKYTMLAKSRPYIKGIWWYDLIDDGDNPAINEHRFGLLNRQEQPKAAALAYEKIAKVARDFTVSDYKASSDGVISIALKGTGNQYAMLYWQKPQVVQPSAQANGLRSLISSAPVQKTKESAAQPLIELNSQKTVLQGDTPVLMLSDKPISSPTR
jgi:hypothetical protein